MSQFEIGTTLNLTAENVAAIETAMAGACATRIGKHSVGALRGTTTPGC